MNNEIALPQNNEIAELTSLAHRINEANQNAQDSSKKAILYAIDCGEALINAKALVKHGEFQGWIEANCTVKYRQAAKYMQLAKHWPELSKVHSDALLELSIDENLALLVQSSGDGIKLNQVNKDIGNDKAKFNEQVAEINRLKKQIEFLQRNDLQRKLTFSGLETQLENNYRAENKGYLALLEIRDEGLYKEKYTSFENYLNERFDLSEVEVIEKIEWYKNLKLSVRNTQP